MGGGKGKRKLVDDQIVVCLTEFDPLKAINVADTKVQEQQTLSHSKFDAKETWNVAILALSPKIKYIF